MRPPNRSWLSNQVTLLLVAAVLGTTVQAGEQDKVNDIILKTEQLYKQGIKIHRQYNFNNLDHVRACVAKHGHLRNKAKELQAKAKTLNKIKHRANLSNATYAAFACVYCGGDGSACNRIPANLLAAK